MVAVPQGVPTQSTLQSVAKRGSLTKALAIMGSALVWLPILAPVFFSAVAFVIMRRFRFDYLMPAELFPSVLLGGGLLAWAALRARELARTIGGALATALGSLVGSQFLAVVTGLASGETAPTGLPWVLVSALLATYWLALVILAVAGGLLVRRLFERARPPSSG